MPEETSVSEYIGQQFGNYRLTRLIGRGGFAEVYLGEHVYLKTQAAIKVLQTRLSREEQEGFYAEARTVAHLQHEHIVRVLEFGLKDESIPYLVMEYAPNGTLRERFPRGTPNPVEHILPAFREVASALHYAHSENLVHRDIKPENMLLGMQNEVLLGDFGIALMIKGSRHQDAHEVAGTVTYMAPEQLMGHPTKASDQYALGVVLYEWLTGTRLFQGTFSSIATQHLLSAPTPLHERAPGISPAVEQVVLRALAKDPYQRFASVQEFANALEAAASNQGAIFNGNTPGSPPTEKGGTVGPNGSTSANGQSGISSATTRVTSRLSPSLLAPLASILRVGEHPREGKGTRRLSRVAAIGLIALVLLLVTGSVFASSLFAPKQAQTTTPQDGQALYAQVTKAAPQISDSLAEESSLSWVPGSVRTCTFKDGALHGLSNERAAICGTTYTYLSDFALQMEVTVVQGTKAGLIFRNELLPNPGAGIYYFNITPQGEFNLTVRGLTLIGGKRTATAERELIKLQRSPAIKTGLGQTNLLSVIGRGPDIYVYINKRFVGHTKDSTSSVGTIGMYAVSLSREVKVDAIFKNMQVWIL